MTAIQLLPIKSNNQSFICNILLSESWIDSKPTQKSVLMKNFFISEDVVTEGQFSILPCFSQKNLPICLNTKEKPMFNIFTILHFCNMKSLEENLDPVYQNLPNLKQKEMEYIRNHANLYFNTNSLDWFQIAVDWDRNGYRLPTLAEFEYCLSEGNPINIIERESTIAPQFTSSIDNPIYPVEKGVHNHFGLRDMGGNTDELFFGEQRKTGIEVLNYYDIGHRGKRDKTEYKVFLQNTDPFAYARFKGEPRTNYVDGVTANKCIGFRMVRNM